MGPSAPASRLAVVLLLVLSPGAPVAQTVHDTGTVQVEVFGNGFLGGRAELGGGGSGVPGAGIGFVFNGVNGLYEGHFLVGAGYEQVSGNPYAGSGVSGPPEWVNRFGPVAISPPLPVPYEEFDEAYGAAYDDRNALSGLGPIGVTVVERSYSSEGEDFVVFKFAVTNTSGESLEDIYIGVFADFDVGDFTNNLGRFDEATESVYVWEVTGTNPAYYGMTAVNGPLSGWDLGVGQGQNPWDPHWYTAISVQSGVIPTTPDDRRTAIGTGPYDLAAGATVVAIFAFVAGEDEADFLANAQAARNSVLLAGEGPAEVGGLRLHEVYPNPSRGRTTVSFSLDAPQPVRLSVFDALGRKVAVLAEGMRAAGEHAVVWDTAALPAGVYVIRAEAEEGVAVRRLTLLR